MLRWNKRGLPSNQPQSSPRVSLLLHFLHSIQTGPLPEEVVFLGQASQDPVVPHGHYPGRKMPLLFGEGALHPGASGPPLQGRYPLSPPSVPSSREAAVVLQAVLHQHHAGLHTGFDPEASGP